MSILPDEIWSKILEMGAATSQLGHRELCFIAITCRRLNRLSGDPALWSTLLALDFPQQSSTPSSSSSSPKSIYKTRFERDKALRLATWRRAVLNAESQVAICSDKLENLEGNLLKESERMKAAVEELNNLERASFSMVIDGDLLVWSIRDRRASVALNIWQPEVIRGSQKQIVEQCTVPIESRLSALKMEVRVCKLHIATYNKAYNDEKQKLSKCKEALKSLKYQPLQSYQSTGIANDCNVKQKKLKRSSGRHGTS